MEPPRKERPGPIDRQPIDLEPGKPQLGLVRQHVRGALGCGPKTQRHDREDQEDLANQDFGRRHLLIPAPASCRRRAKEIRDQSESGLLRARRSDLPFGRI